MTQIGIVDSHFHIWDLEYLRYPWLDNRGILNRSYLFDEYKKSAGKYTIDTAIYCECSGADYRREIQYVSEQAAIHPEIRAAVSWCKLEDKENIIAELERLQADPIVKGVRRLLKKAPAREELCLSEDFIHGMHLLPKYDLVYDMGIVPCLLKPCGEMMSKCPETKFVVEHLAEPDPSADDYEEWAKGIDLIAPLPNVSVKISGLTTHIKDENNALAEVRPYFEYALEKFGFERVMFGSDWPPVNQRSSLEKWIDICFEILSGESEENKLKFFRTNALDFYGIE